MLTLALLLALQDAVPAQTPSPGPPVQGGEVDVQGAPETPQGRLGTAQQGGGDIVVTARRRTETVQKVPIAISVIGGHGDRGDGRLQRRPPHPIAAEPAILLDQPAQLRGQHPRPRRAVRPDQRRHRAGRRHLRRRGLLQPHRVGDLRLPRCRADRGAARARRARSTARTPPPARSTSPPARRPSTSEARVELTAGNLRLHPGQGVGLRPARRRQARDPAVDLDHHAARHDLQRRPATSWQQQPGQSRPARPDAVARDRHARSDAVGRLQPPGPECCVQILRPHRRDPAPAEPPVRRARRRLRLSRRRAPIRSTG